MLDPNRPYRFIAIHGQPVDVARRLTGLAYGPLLHDEKGQPLITPPVAFSNGEVLVFAAITPQEEEED